MTPAKTSNSALPQKTSFKLPVKALPNSMTKTHPRICTVKQKFYWRTVDCDTTNDPSRWTVGNVTQPTVPHCKTGGFTSHYENQIHALLRTTFTAFNDHQINTKLHCYKRICTQMAKTQTLAILPKTKLPVIKQIRNAYTVIT